MRSATDYLRQLQRLFPVGKIWNRDDGSVLTEFLHGQAEELARIDGRAVDLLKERDTRTTLELLTDHEIDLGLPDECSEENETIEARRRAVHGKFIALGQQTPAYFIQLAAAYGYTITITEYTPCWCGVASAGEPCGGPETIFYWKVTIEYAGTSVIYFTSGSSAAGDLLSFVSGTVGLICILNRYKPAHTTLLFEYSGPAFDRSFSTAWNSLPSADMYYLEGAFAYAFDSAFNVQFGGGFDAKAFDEGFKRSV
jgi:uncharacterized protein YmfQ (DUF2313 family)